MSRYEEKKERQELKFGDARGTPSKYSRRLKRLSLGMPRKASPLSSSFISNFTWSYIFIRHMICVLLGASIYFVRICLLLFRTMFCIFYFNKVALIAFTMPMLQVYMLLFENRKFKAVAIIP